MRGWYDSQRGNVSDAFKNQIAVSGTNGLTEFGNAFTAISKTIQEDELHTQKKKLINSQLNSENLNQTVMQNDIDTKAEKWVQKQDDNDYVSNALKHKKQSDFSDAYKVDDTNSPGPDAMTKVNKYFKEQDDLAQTKFNDTALKTATGSYKTFNAFQDANKDLVAMADGTTIAAIKKQFTDTSTQVKNLKTQKTVNDLKSKVDKAELKLLQNSKENKGFKYTQDTGTKITNLISKAMGMDAPDYSMDDTKQKEFNKMVTEVSTLSKDYKLEPNLAYKLYLSNTSQTPAKDKDPLGLLK